MCGSLDKRWNKLIMGQLGRGEEEFFTSLREEMHLLSPCQIWQHWFFWMTFLFSGDSIALSWFFLQNRSEVLGTVHLVRTQNFPPGMHTYVYVCGARNIYIYIYIYIFIKNFAYVINGWPLNLKKICQKKKKKGL